MKGFLIPLISVVFVGCSTGGKLMYDFEMTHPARSKELFFENDTLSMSFEMRPKVISFELYNKLNDGIKISWDEVSLSINGEAYRVVHGETGVQNFTQVQPPTTIPPRTKLKDFVVRTDQIKQVPGFAYQNASTVVTANFPDMFYNKKERDKAMKQKGLKMTLFMPYYVGGRYVSMYYDIYLNNITTTR